MPSKRANVKNEKQYEGLKKRGMSKARAAKIANSTGASKRGRKSSGSSRSKKSSGSGSGGNRSKKAAAGRRVGRRPHEEARLTAIQVESRPTSKRS